MPCRNVTCCSATYQHQCAPSMTLLCSVLTMLQTGAVMLLHSFPPVKHLPAKESSQSPEAFQAQHMEAYIATPLPAVMQKQP